GACVGGTNDMKTVRLDPPAELTMPIGEAMFSQRAIRRLDPGRPISDVQLKALLDAASKAPNGANRQVISGNIGDSLLNPVLGNQINCHRG
ncbi:MAG: hypothetical protein O3A21_04055, partial [Proteobacteria bacterium]|nr:hypothetical protein [Pseudomonadota bacterium]